MQQIFQEIHSGLLFIPVKKKNKTHPIALVLQTTPHVNSINSETRMLPLLMWRVLYLFRFESGPS